ncbi:multidrug effflux MFS transporter [Xanthocytophaga agilis]|uniref:Multidrug effflux MFS transporter n=1 Tax=Xanthocytophaga agilis TaxID=3048010 RepID=A0AAE3RDI7_9BACT|nr:multidrug effflux MFS transporter [Xanthocytophaga agilis]MDJ1506665.1 multidrug effflux MFS transporter [Xanthocytophaga agilis]
MSKKHYFILIMILGSLATISPFSIDMYLPGFPAIAEDLHTSIANVQLSLTAYLVGISVGQLIYGPLLDRFGRKNPLYVGLSLYTLASLGCAMTTSVEALIVMRFLQALGGCVGIVASQALVRDIFPVEKIAQVLSTIMLVIAISPMIAPTVGGYLTSVLSWHWVFVILAAITAIMLLGIRYKLPSGSPPDTSLSLRPKSVINNFLSVIKQPTFLIYALVGGIATSAPFAYIAGSADVFMNLYKVSEQEYGWIFAFLAFAMIGPTQLNHILLRRFKSEQLIATALIGQVIIGAIMITGVSYNLFGKYELIGLLFLFLTGQGIINPNTSALSLAPFARQAGTAAALMGSFRMAMGGLVSAGVSVMHNNTAFPMVLMMALCAFCGLGILLSGTRMLLHADQNSSESSMAA